MCSFLWYFYESVYAVLSFFVRLCVKFVGFYVSVCVCSFVLLCPFLMVCMGLMLVASNDHTLCFVLYYSYLLYFVSECVF